ncbi:MAG: L-seryl-tRNA(Sec) selenium transferase [Actinomycetota bacterium]|nr:L-seryl-tRNA(Sec) selenium transferase [Actinomycetota bacterium]
MTQEGTGATNERLRALPAVDRVVGSMGFGGPQARATAMARRALDEARVEVRQGSEAPDFDAIVDRAGALLIEEERVGLVRVINATGVIIHTNLGRAPMGSEQMRAVNEVAGAYSNLEYDLSEGRRGSRYTHATRLIARVTGAEAAIVVNNNAAAVLLTLAALCSEREVIISRGELVEIGGEFRIPDIMSISGARLVEVGTTNRTHLVDYERAISPDTAAILKVHPSNYKVVGFTSTVPARDLARLATGRGVAFLHDLGSGLVADDAPADFTGEPLVQVALEDGADVALFSGDKLLGGPQAGIIVGRTHHIIQLERHPLLRVLRVDKMTLAALEATLRLYLDGRTDEIPLWRMARTDADELERRARTIAEGLREIGSIKAEAFPTRSVAGGGSLPGVELGSWAVALLPDRPGASELQRSLRRSDPPIVARVEEDRVLLDLRTVAPDDDRALTAAIRRVLG